MLTTELLNAGRGKEADPKETINTLERDFNTFLIKQLHEANLTQGVTTKEDAEKLLFHYRNLSSLLVPARTMVTLTYDKTNDVLHRETQYPVTKKTQAQKAAIEQLSDINPYPLKVDKTAHTAQKQAMQVADSLFMDLMLQDDRALPAQTRKTHLAGAKNAFIVKNELFFDAAAKGIKPDADSTLWLARTGVPVYVGKGETAERIQFHTRENIEQIRSAATKLTDKNLTLHLTTLNTNTFLEKQSKMIGVLKAVIREDKNSKDSMSIASTNIQGTFHALDIDENLYTPNLSKSEFESFSFSLYSVVKNSQGNSHYSLFTTL